MMKSQIGLGVLSIPSAFDTLGIVPGVICLVVIGTITTWSGYMVGSFKLNHRSVYGIDDAGELMFGSVGREMFGIIFALCISTHYSDHYDLLLTLFRLDLHRRFRNARSFHRPQFRLEPCNMHSGLCCRCSSRRNCIWQYSNSRTHQLARVDWLDVHLNCR